MISIYDVFSENCQRIFIGDDFMFWYELFVRTLAMYYLLWIFRADKWRGGSENYGKKANEVDHSLGWALRAVNRRWIVIRTACIYLMWQHWVCFEFAHNQTHSRLSTLYHIESCVCRDENNVMVNKNKAEKKLVKAGSSSLCATKNDSTRPIPDPLLSWCFHCLCSLQI